MRSLDVLRTVPECQDPRQLEKAVELFGRINKRGEERENAQDSPNHHPALHTQNIREIALACSKAFDL
jgi:hypothetical protein